MQLINVNKQTKKSKVQFMNPDLSQSFQRCLMGGHVVVMTISLKLIISIYQNYLKLLISDA